MKNNKIKEDYLFVSHCRKNTPFDSAMCDLCGLTFTHQHRKGTIPKDFEMPDSVGGMDFTPVDNDLSKENRMVDNLKYDKNWQEFDEKFPNDEGLYQTKSGWRVKADPNELKSYILSREKVLIGEIKEWVAKGERKDTWNEEWEEGYNQALSSLLTYLDSLEK